MSKQFTILATDVDLQALDETLRDAGDVELFSGIPTADDRGLQRLGGLAIPFSQAGKVSLFCYLAPVGLREHIFLERLSPVKLSVDEQRSHLIAFWRPFYDGQVVRRGRLYYQNRLVEDGAWKPKDPGFCRWADRVMARVKRTMKYDKERDAYLGHDAAERITTAAISVLIN